MTLELGPGDGFFDRLAAGLSDTLRMEMVVVGRLDAGEPESVRTLAVWADGGPAEPFTYALRGAPCEQVVGRVPCVFPSRVSELFPEDLLLSQNGLSSYVGVPLTAADGDPLGLLAALSRRPLHDGASASRALGLFAARAVAEIERREARLEGGRHEEESRRLVASIPVGLHRYRLEGDGRLVFVGANPAAEAILGVDHRPFVGRTIEEAFPALVGTALPDAYRTVASEGSSGAARRSPTPTAGSRARSSSRRSRPRPARWRRRSSTSRRAAEPRRRCASGRPASRGSTGSCGPRRASARSSRRRRETGDLVGRVCAALVEDRGYVFAWVGLLDDSGNEVRLAGASSPCDPERLPDRPQDAPRGADVREDRLPHGERGPRRPRFRRDGAVAECPM